jgi:hypothetical protein
MKKLALLMSFAFVAGVAGAQEAAKPAEASKPATAMKAGEKTAVKTHEVQAEVVSVDVEKKTLTLKGEMANTTLPVEGKALAALKDVKAGSTMTLTFKDDEKGMHKAVVDIKAPTAEKK